MGAVLERWMKAHGLSEATLQSAVLEPRAILNLELDDVMIISVVTTFFEVFYTNQCYQQYLHFYFSINHFFRASQRLAFEVCLHIAPAGRQYVRLMLRWMRINLVVFFTELRHGSMQSQQWDQLVQIGL